MQVKKLQAKKISVIPNQNSNSKHLWCQEIKCEHTFLYNEIILNPYSL